MHNYPGRPGYQQFPVNSPYGAAPNGMKRPSGDGFGPPSKYPRPVSKVSYEVGCYNTFDLLIILFVYKTLVIR